MEYSGKDSILSLVEWIISMFENSWQLVVTEVHLSLSKSYVMDMRKTEFALRITRLDKKVSPRHYVAKLFHISKYGWCRL